MRRNLTIFLAALCAVTLGLLVRGQAQGQAGRVPSRITTAIDESRLAVLRGNTHPLARSAFDRGPAANSLQMDEMLLVLQRSPAQQAALDRLLAAQQDRTSPSYHQWLSPDEFGQQFGASDADIQKITAWLESHGFVVNSASHGRTVINFSGNAQQVRSAFHTTIHDYFVNDRDHLSNATDPAIPAALVPVVAGVRSLNDFFPKPKYRASAAHGMTASIHPHLTLTDAKGNTLFGVGPTDFATIYGITPLWNASTPIDGTGVTIAIVSASDINTTDADQFRALFGLPAIKFAKVIPQGSTDPGVVASSANGGPDGDEDETEAIFDVEWSGAVAKNANIDLVASKDSATSAGIDLSAQYIVDQDLAPILSESYGNCELGLGSAGNAFYNNLWSQAAAEGITVSIATGDNGSDGCDFAPSGNTTGAAAGVYGLGVNGIASTPYDVAVGGTDFNNHTSPNAFWNSSNASGTLASAKSYVPETTWNDSCTNPLIYTTFGQSSAAAACNTGSVQTDGNTQGFYFVAPVGGSGGVSNCTTANTTTTSNCSGGYAKPSWQTGPGVPADGKRDIPDVSFFAEGAADSYGLEQAINAIVPGSFYFACEQDAQGSGGKSAACSTNGAFLLAGGTSISAQVFAGVMALVDQKTASPQGNINPSFYSLAASQSGLNCNSSSTTTLPDAACIFHDVTSGTIAMPCTASSSHDGTNDCDTSGGGTIGILTGYNAASGYDLATGLGSMNVANFVASMPYLSLSASPATVTVPAAGQSGGTTLTFVANNGFTATINNLSCSNLPAGATCSFTQNGSAVSSLSFNNATTSANVTLTVNTTAGSIAPVAKFVGPMRHMPPAVLVLAGCLILAIFWFRACRNLRRFTPAFGVLGFVLLLGMAGCGGAVPGSGANGTGTPSGSSTATITATNAASNAVMSFNFSLSIQ
ncbi:MAG TPA: S53 family peptidase [Candidatus Acidoferrales bacterium]|nr:S53 family peptidase [Candidatus Acidoferrales bacterium]